MADDWRKEFAEELQSPFSLEYLQNAPNFSSPSDSSTVSSGIEDLLTEKSDNDELSISRHGIKPDSMSEIDLEDTLSGTLATGEELTFNETTNLSDITESTPDLSVSLNMNLLRQQPQAMLQVQPGLASHGATPLLQAPPYQERGAQRSGGKVWDRELELLRQAQQRLVDERLESQEVVLKQQMHEKAMVWANEREKLQRELLEKDEMLQKMRMALEDRKDLFRHLEISEARFLELQQIDEGKLSLKEFVSMISYQRIKSSREETERARVRLAQVEEDADILREQLALKERELMRTRASLENAERSAGLDAEKNQQRIQDLENELLEAQMQMKELEHKGKEFDHMKVRAGMAEKEWETAKRLLDTQAAALHQATIAEKEANRRSEDVAHEADILKVDKEYLKKELEAAQVRSDREERLRLTVEKERNEVRLAHEGLVQQLAELRTHARTEYEERLQREVDRLKEHTSKDLALVREAAQEAAEREARILREAKKDLQLEVDSLREQLARQRLEYNELAQHGSKVEAASSAKETELRNQAQLLRFELASLGTTHEEVAGQLRAVNLENEKLQALVHAHQTEFLNLRTTSEQNETYLQKQLKDANSRVEMYEKLEVDLDQAILQAGEMQINGGDSGNAAMALTSTVPVAPQRRVQQTIRLAQRLIIKEREVEKLLEDISKLSTELEETSCRAKQAEKELEDTQIPTKYLVETVRRKEGEIQTLKDKYLKLKREKDNISNGFRQVHAEKMKVDAELKKAVQYREQIDELRKAIKRMQLAEEIAAVNNKAEDGKDMHMEDDPINSRLATPRKSPSEIGTIQDNPVENLMDDENMSEEYCYGNTSAEENKATDESSHTARSQKTDYGSVASKFTTHHSDEHVIGKMSPQWHQKVKDPF